MGKILMINGADFSTVAVDKVTPGYEPLLYTYSGTSDGSTCINIGLPLLNSSEYTQWTMYINWSYDVSVLYGDNAINSIISCIDSTSPYPGFQIEHRRYSSSNTDWWFVRFSDKLDGTFVSNIEDISIGNANCLNYYNYDDIPKKIGVKRDGENGYITFDGINWYHSTEKLPYTGSDNMYIFNQDGNNLCDVGTTVNLKIYVGSDYDIADKF